MTATDEVTKLSAPELEAYLCEAENSLCGQWATHELKHVDEDGDVFYSFRCAEHLDSAK